MASSSEEQKARYPLPVYNYRVTVDGESMAFSEVSGVQVEFDHVTYRHGFSFIEGEQITTYKIDKYVPVTFKLGTVHRRSALYEWLDSREVKMVEVSLCDERGEPVVSWRLAKAIPTKLDAPSFDAGSNDVSIESLEVRAAGITLVHH